MDDIKELFHKLAPQGEEKRERRKDINYKYLCLNGFSSEIRPPSRINLLDAAKQIR